MIMKACRQTYIRDHLVMAALGAGGATLVLLFMGSADPWVGLIGAVAAIGFRGWLMASEELAVEWRVEDGMLTAPGREVPLPQVADVRTVLSAVQVIARDGNKYLIKYQSDPKATAAQLRGLLP